MLNPLLNSFDVTEHHGRAAASSQSVPDTHDIEPVVGHDFATRDFAADSIDQDFSAATGQTPQSRGLESRQDFFAASSC